MNEWNVETLWKIYFISRLIDEESPAHKISNQKMCFLIKIKKLHSILFFNSPPLQPHRSSPKLTGKKTRKFLTEKFFCSRIFSKKKKIEIIL